MNMHDLEEGWIAYPENSPESASLADNKRHAFDTPAEAIRDAVRIYGPQCGRLLLSDRLLAEPSTKWVSKIPEYLRVNALWDHGRVVVGKWMETVDARDLHMLEERIRDALLEWMDIAGNLPDWYDLTSTRPVTDEEVSAALNNRE